MLLDAKQAAKYLTISTDTLHAEVQAGRLVGFKIAYRWRFDVRDLDAYIDERRREAALSARLAREPKKAKVTPLQGRGAQGRQLVAPVWIPGMKLPDVYKKQ